MSLDQNLFTLFLTPNTSYTAGSAVVDLIDNHGTIHYRKRRIVQQEQQQQLYRIEVTDPLSEALLASATAPSATSKHKTLELYNPTKVVELKFTGTLTFRWSFKWETHEFEWKREECFIIRKPDPPVLVAVTKEPPGRIKTASVQILDYNLNRFDIDDRKGLEIVILTALLTFQDASDVYHDHSDTSTGAGTNTANNASGSAPPTPPPKPTPKKGVERIAELQMGKGQVNEVTVHEEGPVADYAKHCVRLLQDEAMLFISVRSSEPKQVPKVLQVAEETKRLRYKAGDEDLHQYVVYDTKDSEAMTPPTKGPRIINLNDDHGGKDKTKKEYTPPTSLTVHLSKIDMPELRPRGTQPQPHGSTRHGRSPDSSGNKSDKDPASKRSKEKEKARAKESNKHGGGDHRSKDAGRAKRPSLPEERSTSPPLNRPPVLRKYRTQYFQPTGMQPPAQGAPLSRHAPPISPRPQAAQHYSGTLRDRQAGFGSLSGEYAFYESAAAAPTSSATTSGLFGRLLGRS